MQRPGPHRRLTLAPGALSPAALDGASRPGWSLPTSTGSHFATLRVEEGDVVEAEDLAVSVAEGVLAEDRVVSCDDVHRPAKSDTDLAQEFMEFLGFR